MLHKFQEDFSASFGAWLNITLDISNSVHKFNEDNARIFVSTQCGSCQGLMSNDSQCNVVLYQH